MRRFPRLFALQLLLLVTLLACCDLTSSMRSRNRKKSKINICYIKDQKAPMNCNCPNHNITEVDCWVVKPLAREDSFWGHFASQHMEKLLLKQHENGILDYVPTHVLYQLKNLRTFELSYAQITELPEYSFANLTGLSELRVTDSKTFSKLHQFSIVHMYNLTIIDLGRNNISEIKKDTFINLPILRTLYLDHNVIGSVRDQAFKHLNSLQKLVLSHNKINAIGHECFGGLRNLQQLDLRNNDLGRLATETFIVMPELQVLELDNNRIYYIDSHAFKGLHKLRKLYLSGNDLTRLEPTVFDSVKYVHFLDLRRNYLQTMTLDNMKSILTNLYNANSSFYLGENLLTCDCKLIWIWGLRNETRNMHIRSLLDKLTCVIEINNGTDKAYSEKLEKNQAQEITQSAEENAGDNSRYSDGEDDSIRDEDDRDNYEDVELEVSLPTSSIKTVCEPRTKICKLYLINRLFDMKIEDLPCVSREDLMASEQPSSHNENTPIGRMSIWFNSGQAVRSVLAVFLLPLLFVLFT